MSAIHFNRPAAACRAATLGLAFCFATPLYPLADPAPEQAAALKGPLSDSYDLAARINLSQGFVKEAAWLDDDELLVLMLSPEDTSVLKVNYDTLAREKLISSEFVYEHICSPELAMRLTWTVSPRKQYIFFSWFLDDGSRDWSLVDIGYQGGFRLRRFEPLAGMQIDRVLFSPDDRYGAFFHDSYSEGGIVSVLTMDLEEGTEHWRIGTQQLSFISRSWWGGAVFDAPRFYVTASVCNAVFSDNPCLALCDVTSKSIEHYPNQAQVILGAEPAWGHVSAYRNAAGGSPFLLRWSMDGGVQRDSMALTSRPDELLALPAPGLVLIGNSENHLVNELWLIDLNDGSKYLVDSDCASFDLNSVGRLLVRAEKSNELRIYSFTRLETPVSN